MGGPGRVAGVAASRAALYVAREHATLSVGGRVRVRYETVDEDVVELVLEDRNGQRIRVPLYRNALRKLLRIGAEYARGTTRHHVPPLEA